MVTDLATENLPKWYQTHKNGEMRELPVWEQGRREAEGYWAQAGAREDLGGGRRYQLFRETDYLKLKWLQIYLQHMQI